MSWLCCHFYEITWPKTWILWVLRTERCGASSFPITGTNSFGRAILINLNIGQTKTLKKRVLSYLVYTVDSVLDQSQPLVAISKGKAQEILGNVHSSAEGSCTLEMTPGRLDCGAVWAAYETHWNSRTNSLRAEPKRLLKYLITPSFCAKFQPNWLMTTFGPWNTFSDRDT